MLVRHRGGELLPAQITSRTFPAKTTRATQRSSSTRWTASSVNQPSSRQMGGASGWPFPPNPSASLTLSSVCWRLFNGSVRPQDHQLVVMLRFFSGATVDTVFNGVNAKPDLFPENSKDVPDINFFYRCTTKDRVCFCRVHVLIRTVFPSGPLRPQRPVIRVGAPSSLFAVTRRSQSAASSPFPGGGVAY